MTRSIALLIPAIALLAACVTPGRTAFDDGVRLYREGYFLSARDAFDIAIRQDPRLATAWNNRGVARVRLGDLHGAIMDYTEAMRLDPGDAEIVFNRGNAYAAAGSLPPAIEDFSAAARLRPDYAQAFFNRGTVRAAAGDVRGALTDWQFAAAIERDPWTRAAMQRGSGVDAVYASPRLPAITPQALDVRALVARAMSREVDGDRAGAIADLRAAFAAEVDADRRARIDRLLRTLEAAR